MDVASRTPEGYPSKCPVCGGQTDLEFSEPSGDAPCPNCGHLLWRSEQMIGWIQQRFTDVLNVRDRESVLDLAFVEDWGADSLDMVELVMELEEEFDVSIPEEQAMKIRTIRDLLRVLRDQIE